MDHKGTVEKVVEIENRYDVNSVIYKDIRIWPVIRHVIFYLLLNPKRWPDYGVDRAKAAPANPRSVAKLKSYFKTRKETADAKRENERELDRLGAFGQRDMVFFSSQTEHVNLLEGKYYNHILDPMVELVKDKYSFFKFERYTREGEKKVPRFVETELVKPGYYFKKRAQGDGLPASSAQSEITGFAALKELVQEVTGTVILDVEFLKRRCNDIFSYREFFTDILKKLRPKAVFLVCYYYPVALGLISACRRIGIPTVEVQHGKQGRYHGFYTRWTKVPEEGYEFLPDYFWVWGEECALNINRWLPEGCHHHRAIIGGNRWLAKWVDAGEIPLADEAKVFFRSLDEMEKVILFSMQPIKEFMPEHVLKAMKSSPKSWKWLLRLHPTQVRKGEIEEIRSVVEAQGIDNYEIDITTKCQLFALLQHVDHHLTAWSTVCYEALAFGVPTTIIHPNGLDIYRDYIEKNIFHYSESSESLIDAIDKEYSLDDLKESTRYVETDIAKGREAIGIILEANETERIDFNQGKG